MKFTSGLLAIAMMAVPAVNAAPPQQSSQTVVPPPWAYPVNPPDDKPPADDGPHSVPNSSKSFTRPQILDTFNVPDWHPEDHPAMPDVVEHGRKPAVRACGYCHLPTGLGRPENASVAGLSADYIVEQVAEFKSGARKSSEPKMQPPNAMIAAAKGATDEDVKIAAQYFASLKLKPWVKVVEATTVPKTRVSATMLIQDVGAGSEPLGNRIIELPEDLSRARLRDSASGFVAYVPPGSIQKGEAIVTSGGGGKTVRCAICHGPELHGIGPVPPLAGRSATYIFRQLFDIQQGTRNGEWTALMYEPLAKLSQDDLISIAAYLASLNP